MLISNQAKKTNFVPFLSKVIKVIVHNTYKTEKIILYRKEPYNEFRHVPPLKQDRHDNYKIINVPVQGLNRLRQVISA